MRILDFFRLDRVFEIRRVQTVASAVGGFQLRIHSEGDFWQLRSGQFDVVTVVVRQPVHFPGAKQFLSRPFDLGIGQR